MTSSQTKPNLTIDERILAIEAALPMEKIAGTTLSRCLAEVSGLEWVLSVGPIQAPKTFFRGPSIEDVVSQCEKAIEDMQTASRQRLLTDWEECVEEISLIDPSSSPAQN